MSSLPSGVVTFLMTDIVGSTPMWERAPHQMDIALQRHDALIDEAVLTHGGFLLRHRGEGDSTFSVFQSATAALAAAHEAQRRLRNESWPTDTPIVVRMGLHSGEALIRSAEYHGRVVNRAARVRSVAAGGQILISGTTATLLDGSAPDGTDVRFVRFTELPGIDGSEALHELVDPTMPLPEPVDEPTTARRELPTLLRSALPRVFSGRGELLVRLAERRAAAPTHSVTVLLGGEPGAGKTALAANFAQRSHEEGWTVLAGACDESGATPYGAVREVIRDAISGAPREVLDEHVAVHGGTLARVTDRLVARLGALGPDRSDDLDTTRRLLVDAVDDLLGRLTRVQPLLIVVDDVQWADHNTLEVLERLIGADHPGLMLVATYRSGHADVAHFGAWLIAATAREDVTDLVVDGFATGELRMLLHTLAGHELGREGESLLAHLQAETGGNPFLVVELIRLLVQQGTVSVDDRGRWRLSGDLDATPIPQTARSVLTERLGRLGDRTIRALEAATVLGRDFEPATVAEVLQAEELDVLDALEPAQRASLVREIGVGRFQFTHALVQHTLYETIGATRRSALHRRAAVTLSTARPGEPAAAATVAGHWLRVDRAGQADVLAWCRRAGDEAMAALAPEEAARWYERALGAAGDDAARLDLMIELGKAQRWTDGATFRGTLLAAASLAEAQGDADALIRAALANHRGGASRAGAVDAERVAVLERALVAAGPTDSPERALLLATIAMERSQGSEIERSIELADEADAVARRLQDEDTLFTVLLRITEAIRIPATLERRLLATDELFEIAVRLDDPVQLGFAAVRDIRTKFEAAQFDMVDRAFEVLAGVAHLDPFVHHNQSSLLAVRAQFAGSLPEALAHAEHARRLGLSENDAAAVYLSTASMIRWDMGSLAEMLPPLEHICREFPGVVGFQPTAGLARLAAGDRDGARAILTDAAARRFGHLPLNPLWAMTVSVFATLCTELDDGEAAVPLYELLRPLQGRANISVVSGNGLTDESLAGLAASAGRPDDAARHAIDVLAQAERLRMPPSLARMHLLLARLGHGDAVTHARTASHIARRHGMERVASQADAWLRG